MTFLTYENKLRLLFRSSDTAQHNVRVRENQIEEFIRAYEAGGTSKTKDNNNDNKRKIRN